ncbi:MAG: polysaccharide deacetylase family protein [Patescibacteria group bacterium]|nr:polysaccharide deacetylase family protein [Patescibacteria group bacterium]
MAWPAPEEDKPRFVHPPPPSPTPGPRAQEVKEKEIPLASVYRHGDRSLPLVALTIDDAWNLGNVRTILDIAKRRGVKLTLFPTGRMIDADLALWQRAFEEGHEIENHTYSHSWLTGLSEEGILREIDMAQAAVDRACRTHVLMRFIRPPGMAGFTSPEGTKWIRATIAKRGLGVALWDIDSESTRQYGRINTDGVFRAVGDRVQNGSIVLQHFIETDVEAFPMILDELKRRNLTPVTLSELLKRSGHL